MLQQSTIFSWDFHLFAQSSSAEETLVLKNFRPSSIFRDTVDKESLFMLLVDILDYFDRQTSILEATNSHWQF